MSNNVCRVFFPDGTILWGVVTTSDGMLALPPLYDTEDDAWDALHDTPQWADGVVADVEPVVIESHYGGAEWWLAQASRTAKVITNGHDPYAGLSPDAPSPIRQGLYRDLPCGHSHRARLEKRGEYAVTGDEPAKPAGLPS